MTALYSTPGVANLEALGITVSASQINAAGAGLPESLTASRALVTDGTGTPAVATTTAAEIGYVNGVTSAIQTQLNAKKKNWVAVPATAGAAGTAGDTAYEAGFLYVCVATNTWQRVVLDTWA